VRRGGSPVESCTRTIHGLPFLTPSHDSNELLGGCLGKAAEYYDVDIYGFGFASTHFHILYGADHRLQMSRFQGHLNSNIAREIGRLHGWREKFFGRRYRGMGVSDQPADQRERLKYMLGQGVKAGLVARALDWPGLNAARALLNDEPIVGVWFNRTKEYYARRKGIDFGKYDYATHYEIHLKPLPAFQDDSPEEYRAMIAEILGEIEEEAAANRGGRLVLGVDMILAQDPCQPLPGKPKKSPVPVLFFSKRPELRKKMENDYKDFQGQGGPAREQRCGARPSVMARF